MLSWAKRLLPVRKETTSLISLTQNLTLFNTNLYEYKHFMKFEHDAGMKSNIPAFLYNAMWCPMILRGVKSLKMLL